MGLCDTVTAAVGAAVPFALGVWLMEGAADIVGAAVPFVVGAADGYANCNSSAAFAAIVVIRTIKKNTMLRRRELIVRIIWYVRAMLLRVVNGTPGTWCHVLQR